MLYYEVRRYLASQGNHIGYDSKGGITHCNVDPMVLTINFYCLDLVFLVRETFFILMCVCLGASKYLNLHLKLHFPAIYCMENYKVLCLSGSNIMAFQDDTKTSKFLSFNFS